MGKSTATAIFILTTLALTGCQTNNPLGVNTRTPPQPLPSVPAGTVQSGQLDPISGELQSQQPLPGDVLAQPVDGQASLDPSSQSTQTAALGEPVINPNAEPLSREALTGSWIVNSDNPNCRLIISFTKWDGGYRAATRRCQSPEIASITAWDVKGQQVILVDVSGNTIGRLYSSGNDRYDGTTNSGQPISISR